MPINLTDRDWEEIYAALDSKLKSPTTDGDSEWRGHLTDIMERIGGDGAGAAEQGVEPYFGPPPTLEEIHVLQLKLPGGVDAADYLDDLRGEGDAPVSTAKVLVVVDGGNVTHIASTVPFQYYVKDFDNLKAGEDFHWNWEGSPAVVVDRDGFHAATIEGIDPETGRLLPPKERK